VRHPVAEVAQSHQIKNISHSAALPVLAAQPKRNITFHVEVGEKRSFLKHHPHPAFLRSYFSPWTADYVSSQRNRAAIGLLEAGYEAKSGGLAASAGAKKNQHLTRRYPEVQVMYHLNIAKAFV
jgi:hypothetical protein